MAARQVSRGARIVAAHAPTAPSRPRVSQLDPSELASAPRRILTTPPVEALQPIGRLALKPGSKALDPSRVPAPIAIVRSREPSLAALPEAMTEDTLPAAPFAMSSQDVPAAAATTSTIPPVEKSSTLPAGGPAASYEHAFRSWSMHDIVTTEEQPMTPREPASFQVYTAQDIRAGRRPMRSVPELTAPKKSHVALRAVFAAVGLFVVLLTVAAVAIVSSDEPKRVAEIAPIAAPVSITTIVAESKPATILIGDPVDVIDELDAK